MLEILKSIILGIVEGITEWLPVSSTGHLILVNEFIKLKQSDEFIEMFDVVIQLGAIMAVVVIFWKKLWPFGKKNNAHPLNNSPFGQMVKTDIFQMWFKVLVACIPAAVIGLLLDDWINEHFYNPWCVSIALIVFGIAFILIENHNKGRKPKVNTIDDLTYKAAFIIGYIPAHCGIVPRNFAFGFNYRWSSPYRNITNCCRRIHVLPRSSGNVRRESPETYKVRL